MAIVNEQVVFKDVIKNCNDLSEHLVRAVDRKAYGYTSAYIIFDHYSLKSSLKDTTRKRHTGGKIIKCV